MEFKISPLNALVYFSIGNRMKNERKLTVILKYFIFTNF